MLHLRRRVGRYVCGVLRLRLCYVTLQHVTSPNDVASRHARRVAGTRRASLQAVTARYSPLQPVTGRRNSALQAVTPRNRQKKFFEKDVQRRVRAARDAIERDYSPESVRRMRQAETRRKTDLAARHMSELDALATIRLEQRGKEEARKFAMHDMIYEERYAYY